MPSHAHGPHRRVAVPELGNACAEELKFRPGKSLARPDTLQEAGAGS